MLVFNCSHELLKEQQHKIFLKNYEYVGGILRDTSDNKIVNHDRFGKYATKRESLAG